MPSCGYKILVGRYSTHYGASLLSTQLSPSYIIKSGFTSIFITLPNYCLSGHGNTWPAQWQVRVPIVYGPSSSPFIENGQGVSRLILQLTLTSAEIILRHILILALRVPQEGSDTVSHSDGCSDNMLHVGFLPFAVSLAGLFTNVSFFHASITPLALTV